MKIQPTAPPGIFAGCSALALLLMSLPATATDCEFFNATTNEQREGQCTVDYGNEGEIITIGKSRFVFAETQRQGQWSMGTLNGKRAARYEIDRQTYSYSTLDLTLFLDRRD